MGLALGAMYMEYRSKIYPLFRINQGRQTRENYCTGKSKENIRGKKIFENRS
jgi:hypothetical protein